MTGVELLLDTHTLLWALTDPDRLSKPARARLEDARSSLHVSAASAWEISTKHRWGKLPQGEVLVAEFSRQVARLGAHELAVTARHTLLAGSLDWAHRDPFDRMLAAQAMGESMTLVTQDEAFATVRGIRTMW